MTNDERMTKPERRNVAGCVLGFSVPDSFELQARGKGGLRLFSENEVRCPRAARGQVLNLAALNFWRKEFALPQDSRPDPDLTPAATGSLDVRRAAVRKSCYAMKTLLFPASRLIAPLLAALLIPASRRTAQPPASEQPQSIAAQLQPFVDSHTL